MIATVHRLGGRFLIMLSGEAMQSLFAFALNIVLARTLPAGRYGLYAIIVLIGGFCLIYMRALIGVPACIYIPRSRRATVARFHAVMFGSAALAAAILSAAMVAAVLAIWDPLLALAAGVFVGSWCLRGYVRMVLFAQGRAGLATFCDGVFTIAATVLCVPVLRFGGVDGHLPDIFFILAIAHLIGAGLALVALRQPIRLSFRSTLRHRMLRLLPSMTWSIISVTMANIQGQGAILLLAVVAGPAAYAPIAATMALFSPLRLAATALANLTQPDLSAKLGRPHTRDVFDVLLVSTSMMIAVCAIYGVGMWVFFPSLAAHVFGQKFGAAPLGLIAVNLWFISTISVVYSVPKALLESAMWFKAITVLSLGAALVSFPVVALLLKVATPAHALVGVILSEFVVMVGSWILVVGLLKARALGRTRAVARRVSSIDGFPIARDL